MLLRCTIAVLAVCTFITTTAIGILIIINNVIIMITIIVVADLTPINIIIADSNITIITINITITFNMTIKTISRACK